MDERLADELLGADVLAGATLAVRSSALFEDAAERSWAGQFTTVLNVRDAVGLCRAVRAVRESYAKSISAIPGHVPGQTLDLSADACIADPVLIQRQVEARYAGVCFTADPGSGIESLSVVEAVCGLGESLVSGRADPVYVRIDRRTGEPVAVKGVNARSREGRAFLKLARQVADLAQRAEGALAVGPLDIEWAWDGEQLWLLQARPVTTPTFSLPERAPLTEPEIWFHGNFAETMPGAVPPLVWDVLQQATLRQRLPLGAEKLIRHLRADLIECLAGRVCWNVSFLSYWGALNRRTLDALALIDAGMVASIRRLFEQGVIAPRQEPGGAQRGRMLLSLGLLGGRIFIDAACAWRRGRIAAMHDMEASARRLVRSVGSEAPDALSIAESWRRVGFLIRGLWPSLLPHVGTFKMLGLPLLFGALASRWSGRPLAEVAGLMFDQEPSWARRLDQGLRDLGCTLSAAGVSEGRDPAGMPADVQVALTAFLDEFGHRAPGEQDLSRPRFREQTGLVIELALIAAQQPAARVEDSSERTRLFDVVRSRRGFGWLQARVLRWLAPRAAQWAPVREDAKHVFWMPIWACLRELILRVGTGLREQGVLAEAEDVFLFTCSDLDALCSSGMTSAQAKHLIEVRRRQRSRWLRFDFAYVVRSDGVPVDLTLAEEAGGWRGTPVSGGSAEGVVRIAHCFEEALTLQPGEVLVATHLDPGWTALFSRAGALVMEVGGVVSHASVIARELGIPAVAGVIGATKALRNGERIRVDGRTGLVTRTDHVVSSE